MRSTVIALFAGIMLAPEAGAVNYRGDFNRDSRLDMHDMTVLARAINDGTADPALFDINADGVVDDRDLETVANIILSQSLVEDTGVNVGIGGWGNGGEWGGTVGISRKENPRQVESGTISLYGRNGYDYGTDVTFSEIFIDADRPVSGLLIDFGVPSWEDFVMDEESVTLNVDLLDDHRLYGRMAKVIQRDSPVVRYRVIIFSPDFRPLDMSEAPLIRFRYEKNGVDWRVMPFENCQAVLPSTGDVADIPRSENDMWWDYVPIRDMQLSETCVQCEPGDFVDVDITWIPENVSSKDYEVEISNEDAVYVSYIDSDWLMLGVKSKEATRVTLHTKDGSDITRTIDVNNGTGVNPLEDSDAGTPLPVYTLQGIPLGVLDSDALRALPSGLYIRGGRKLRIP